MTENDIATVVIESAMSVHTALGAGLLESAYEACLAYELLERGGPITRQLAMPVRYKGVQLDIGYRLDLLVGEKVVVEIKTVDQFSPVHMAQILSYLKLGGYALGIILNFNTPHMRLGIRRVANNL